ncbi:hypothetical protein DM01DRAFT_1374945 [Hesseltinella vesiculosa]|uniref:Uncharacterized protein n=1 Tax=Hesseltinella vesiculosa TaxID=101127 RepID=A0A1X2GEZ3_9FUNG|nr:hypothetical protein DM01DRAFT_1374945 [Hesseltinella vesiculosa]
MKGLQKLSMDFDTTGNRRSHEFALIIKYALTDFHMICQAPSVQVKHERTAFVEFVIPYLKALDKWTGLVKIGWCEKDLNANKLIVLNRNDTLKNAVIRKIDALGTLNTSTTMEDLREIAS